MATDSVSAPPTNQEALTVSDDEVLITGRRSRRSNAGKPAERLHEGNEVPIDNLFSDSDEDVKATRRKSKSQKGRKEQSRTPKTSKTPKTESNEKRTDFEGGGRRSKEAVVKYEEEDSMDSDDFQAPRKKRKTEKGPLPKHLCSEMHIANEVSEPTVVQTLSCQSLNGILKRTGERDGFTQPVICCTTCVKRQMYLGTCRFKDFRVFSKEDRSIWSFKSTQQPELEEDADLPLAPAYLTYGTEKISKRVRNKINFLLNDSNREQYASEWLGMIAPAFSSKLEQELKHENAALGFISDEKAFTKRPVVRLEVDPTCRRKCDICYGGVLFGAYLCGGCGTELCLDCWEQYDILTKERNGRACFGKSMARCSAKVDHERPAFYLLTTAHPGEAERLLMETTVSFHDLWVSTNYLPSSC